MCPSNICDRKAFQYQRDIFKRVFRNRRQGGAGGGAHEVVVVVVNATVRNLREENKTLKRRVRTAKKTHVACAFAANCEHDDAEKKRKCNDAKADA